MPQHLAAEELLGVMRVEPGFPLAIADLLVPVRFHARAAVVPHERRRRESDAQPLGLQPPADIDVVARAEVDRVEAVDRQQRVPAERHIAARDVLCDAVVEHHVGGPPGGARDALRHPRVFLWHDVGPARASNVGREHRLDEVRQPVGVDPGICVGVGDDLTGCGGEADVAGRAEPSVWHVDDAHAGMLARDRCGGVTRSVIDDDDFHARVGQRGERGEAVVYCVGGVVRAHHHRDLRPPGALVGRERRLGEYLPDGRQRRLRMPRVIDEAESPVVDGATAAPPLVGPGVGHRAAGTLRKGRTQVHRGDARLSVQTLAHAVATGFRQQERFGAGDVLQPREIPSQIRFSMQIDVEGADVEAVEVEVFGGREIHVGEEAFGRRGLDLLVQLAQKSVDAALAVPAHDPGGNLVADGKQERRRVRRQPAHRGRRAVPDLSCQLGVVEKWDVLRPCQPYHHSESVPHGCVEQADGWHRVGADGVDAGSRHQRKVLGDPCRRRELSTLAIGREGAVRHPLHEETAAVHVEELAIDTRCRVTNGSDGSGSHHSREARWR